MAFGGVVGHYELDYPFVPSPPTAPAAPTEFVGPSLSTAVQEQRGLLLVPSKGA